MQKLICITFILAMSGLAGCAADPKERAAEADAAFKEERLNILQNYQKCVEQAKGDEKMLKSCEHYLKAIDSMK
jgi:uncharacterized protein (UPF0210 family)